MAEKNITVSVNTETYEKIRKIAFDEKSSIKAIVNEFLAEGIQNRKGQTKLD